MNLLTLHGWELINGTLSNPRFFKEWRGYEQLFEDEINEG